MYLYLYLRYISKVCSPTLPLTEDVEYDGGHPDPGGVGRVLHLARQTLAEVVLLEFVLQRRSRPPPFFEID